MYNQVDFFIRFLSILEFSKDSPIFVIILVLILINIVILLSTDWYEYYRKGAKSKFMADINNDRDEKNKRWAR